MASAETPTSPIREHVLANGLKVLVKEVRTAPLVSVWCWYRVGSADEGPGVTGVSHWCEHMNFKGTTNIPRDQVKGIIEQYGGFWNGYTFLDQTTYVETASTEAFEKMLFIEAERMAGCLYHPDDCESERTVIISELQGGENDPEQLLDQELTAAAFRAHPYRNPVIGWQDDLQTMTRDDLYAHYRRHYRPNNATLVIVGDVDADEALARAEHHFGAIAPGPAARRVHTKEPEQVGERRVTVSREGTAAYLKVAFHAPAVTDPDFFPMLVLDAVLTGAKGLSLWASFRTPPPQRSTRLYKALVDGGLASSVQGAMLPTRDPFLFMVSATLNDGADADVLEETTLAELERVRQDGVTEDELRRAKAQLRARLVFENNSVTNIGHQIGFFETVASWQFYDALLPGTQAVTQAQVAEVAAKYLVATNRTIGWFEPVPEETDEEAATDAGAAGMANEGGLPDGSGDAGAGR